MHRSGVYEYNLLEQLTTSLKLEKTKGFGKHNDDGGVVCVCV